MQEIGGGGGCQREIYYYSTGWGTLNQLTKLSKFDPLSVIILIILILILVIVSMNVGVRFVIFVCIITVHTDV